MTAVAPRIALIGTLDTKGAEIEYVRNRIRALGGEPIVIDSGILGSASGAVADVTREQVAAAGGHLLDDIRNAGSRGRAVEMMRDGVRAVCVRLHAEGRLHGALCLGGAEGALLGAYAMQALPLGVPKVIVSPSASGRRVFGPFMGSSDVLVMHSVVDILGLNPIAISVFDNAVAAVVGMATHAGRSPAGLGGRSVGVTMLGQTTPGVMHLRDALERAGWEDRLTVAGDMGLPQVVVPGCVDFFNQGAPDTLPEIYRRRRSYYHNPVATLVRLEPDEMAELGRIVAKRLNGASGPVSVVAPTRGFSLSDTEGNALWYPEADAAFIDSLEANLRPGIAFERVDATVNDPAFADVVADRYLTITKEHVHA